MEEFQGLMERLDTDRSSGKLLPTAELAQAAQNACPLDREGLGILCRCIAGCTEQIYEYYRALIDLFRREAARTTPDADTIRLAVKLGLLDDESWLPIAQEQEG